jgi:nucleotide-binding universal stress UspA family protein
MSEVQEQSIEQEYKRILVGLDGSPQADYAFECAVEVAKRNNGTVVAVAIIQNQMYDMTGYGNVTEDVMNHEIDQYKGLLEDVTNYAKDYANFTDVETEIVVGSPKELLAHTLPKKFNADLIMVGQSGMSAFERMMVGSVSQYVLRHSSVDVLIIHPQPTE